MILMAIATTLTTAMVMIVMAVHANDNDNVNSDGGGTWLILSMSYCTTLLTVTVGASPGLKARARKPGSLLQLCADSTVQAGIFCAPTFALGKI